MRREHCCVIYLLPELFARFIRKRSPTERLLMSTGVALEGLFVFFLNAMRLIKKKLRMHTEMNNLGSVNVLYLFLNFSLRR